MKDMSITPGKKTQRQVDKRDLVNLDLYSHEIKVIEKQLNRMVEKHKSKQIRQKLSQLNKELILQKQKLERFRKSCELQQDYCYIENTSTNVNNSLASDEEGFFEHLKAFEENFKNTRNKANDFLRQII